MATIPYEPPVNQLRFWASGENASWAEIRIQCGDAISHSSVVWTTANIFLFVRHSQTRWHVGHMLKWIWTLHWKMKGWFWHLNAWHSFAALAYFFSLLPIRLTVKEYRWDEYCTDCSKYSWSYSHKVIFIKFSVNVAHEIPYNMYLSFVILKNGRMIPFCNLFMVWPSYVL